MATADEHVDSADTNIGTRSVGPMEDDNRATSESSTFCTANKEYFSTRIQSILESKSKFETALECEIEASKAHWSELPAVGNGGEGSSAEKNREAFRRLQQHYNGPDGFFKNWLDDCWAVGEKIAEGAQGEIFKLTYLLPEDAHFNDRFVLKVFKLDGSSLQDLQKQWPPGMLLEASASAPGYVKENISGIMGGVMLSDGRFAFAMVRLWGDLRKVIDLRMEQNGNQAPPFTHDTALELIQMIATGMRGLHKDSIVHRDLTHPMC